MLEKSLEKKILSTSLVSVIAATIALLIHDSVVSYDFNDIILEIIGICIFSTLYLLHRDESRTSLVSNMLMFSVFLLLNISWYTNRGMGIGIVLMFYTAVVIAQLLIQEKYRWWLTGGYSLNMLVILLWEGWSNQFFILGLYPNVSEFPLITKGIFIFITFSVTSWVIIFIKRQYDEAYQLTRQQQEELLFKNKRISNINTELEEKIEQRTQELMQHHEQLLGYAFFHSHDLRAPITNLLTIHEALCLEDLEAGEQNNLIQKLQQETENLDEKIRDVQSMLENRNHSLDHL